MYKELQEHNGDIVLQELITFIKKDGKLVRHITTREFFQNDYSDTSTMKVISNVT
jgi:hypothetical protein